MRKPWLWTSILTVCMVLGVAGVAWAHVEISPGEVPAGQSQEFVAEVPTELDVPTTEVRLEVPQGFEVTEVPPTPGWEGAVEGSTITWSGGEIPVDEAQEFTFQATAPGEAGEFAWNATQTYQDGTVVEWAGAPDSNEPAPVVSVSESGATSGGEDEHQHGDETVPSTGGISPLLFFGAFGAGALVIVLGLVAVGVTLARTIRS